MTRSEFIRKLERGRKLHQKFDKLALEIFSDLEDMGINDASEINTSAENANNVGEAIDCYMIYGEYSPEKIWDEIVKYKEELQ